jgi:hypothetical protein
MWLCMNDAFLSIVADPKSSDDLVVRARRRGDCEAVFPGYAVQEIPARDYQFRTRVPRDVVAAVIAMQLGNIDYGNFKASVFDLNLARAYARVWAVMADLQEKAPYDPHPRAGFDAHPVRRKG